MKVYAALIGVPYEGERWLGVFSTQEKAEARLKDEDVTYSKNYDYPYVLEITVDEKMNK